MSDDQIFHLLQFVPTQEIADNYFKKTFYLKNAIEYREMEEKNVSSSDSNLKFDKLEGKIKNWSILQNCLFISCFTMLSNEDFKTGKLDPQLIKTLDNGNVDNVGNKSARPFITINANNLKKLLNNLKCQVDSYLCKNNLNSSGLFTRKVIYLDKTQYEKKSSTLEQMITPLGQFIDSNTTKISLTCENYVLLEKILKHIYLTKLNYFSGQREYRLGVALDDPIEKKELVIPIINDLSNYVRVHSYEAFSNLKLKDL
ncbi:hypothetical protein [Liquorilactobacillus mali]|uniref:hypothetical protein n=1 Tax=Liquorilactobacillus mali TaxID=1618 RepID=UPI0039EBF5F6